MTVSLRSVHESDDSREAVWLYENTPELVRSAMKLGWTQNVIILEAELTIEERAWYLQAVERFNCSKKELADQISAAAHLENQCRRTSGKFPRRCRGDVLY